MCWKSAPPTSSVENAPNPTLSTTLCRMDFAFTSRAADPVFQKRSANILKAVYYPLFQVQDILIEIHKSMLTLP